MSAHQQFADDLAVYALRVLAEDQRLALEKHLAECSACRRELERLQGDMALLALSTAGPSPPRRARQRLTQAVANEPRAQVAPVRKNRWLLVPWLAFAVVAVVAVIFGVRSSEFQREIASLRSQAEKQQIQLEHARDVVATLSSTDAMHVTLVETKHPPQPQGKAMYLRDRGRLIFMASNMPSLPPQKAYELWLIPMQGAPIAAGMFRPKADGSAMVMNPPIPAGIEAKAFAVTIEPEQGSPTPTMPIMMIGS